MLQGQNCFLAGPPCIPTSTLHSRPRFLDGVIGCTRGSCASHTRLAPCPPALSSSALVIAVGDGGEGQISVFTAHGHAPPWSLLLCRTTGRGTASLRTSPSLPQELITCPSSQPPPTSVSFTPSSSLSPIGVQSSCSGGRKHALGCCRTSVPETSHLISHEAQLQAAQLLRSVLPPILGVRIPTWGRGLHWPPPHPPASLWLLQPDVPCLLRCCRRLTYLSAHTPPYCSSLPLIQLSEIWLQRPSSRSSVTSLEGLGC